MDKKGKVDLRDRSQDNIRLSQAKQQEQRFKPRLKRVDIQNGYVMTTNPEKWNSHEIDGEEYDFTRIFTTYMY